MLQVGDEIEVKQSRALSKYGLSALLKRRGKVTRVLMNGKTVLGAYVDIKLSRKVRNYFIPMLSITDIHSTDRERTIELLKTTRL